MLLNCGVGEDSWESLGLQGEQTSSMFNVQCSNKTEQSQRKSVLNIHWKNWYWSWNSTALATWCEEPTHLKRPWCWERLKAGEEQDNRGWDGWMASLTRWTWVWVNSGSWSWTGRRGHAAINGVAMSRTWLSDWTELNWVPATWVQVPNWVLTGF